MIPIQEIEIYTDGEIHFSAHVVVPNANNIGSEVTIYDPRISEIYSSYHAIGQFQDVDSAYEALIDFCKKYSSAASIEINRINNPCNTEFVEKINQQKIVSNSGLKITVEVNA